MSTSNLPKILVTPDVHRHVGSDDHSVMVSSFSDSNSSNDMNYLQNNRTKTDVEDVNSCGNVQRLCSKKSSSSLTKPNVLSDTEDDVTDIEDLSDSPSNEGDSVPNISLPEFLRAYLQEHGLNSNRIQQTIKHKTVSFSDCEYCNTDSEMGNNFEKLACVNLKDTFVGYVDITDTIAKAQNCNDDSDNASISSNISCVDSALSEVVEKALQVTLEDDFGLSSSEEIYQISRSDSGSISNPVHFSEDDILGEAHIPIDVTFSHPTKLLLSHNHLYIKSTAIKDIPRKQIFLEIDGKNKEQVLTDTERLDDSVAESCAEDSFDDDANNQQPNPQAVTTSIGENGGCATDCEDIFYDDVSDAAVSIINASMSVELDVIPLPQREFVMLEEDKFGDTIITVIPMDNERPLGIYTKRADECLTDVEEYTCSEDTDLQLLLANFATGSSLLAQNVFIESDSTVTNESLKLQQSKRSEIPSESITDVEEIYMAGTSTRKKKIKSRSATKSETKLLEATKPYTEEDACVCASKRTASEALVANSLITMSQRILQQKETDVENMELPSDSDEATNSKGTAAVCVCQELSDMLSENCTTVHEKSINSFNIDAEKLYLKGMVRDAHTDIEYLESDESAATSSK